MTRNLVNIRLAAHTSGVKESAAPVVSPKSAGAPRWALRYHRYTILIALRGFCMTQVLAALILTMKAAEALGLTIRPALLLRADEVIQ